MNLTGDSSEDSSSSSITNKAKIIMITAMNHITLAVSDIDQSFIFYRDILGLKPLVKWNKGAYFFVGDSKAGVAGSGFWFCLNVDKARVPNPCYTHYAFTVSEENFNLMAAKIVGSGCKLFKENTSPGESLYFLDPDGHKLEIHVGTADMRIIIKKNHPGHWENVEWFV